MFVSGIDRVVDLFLRICNLETYYYHNLVRVLLRFRIFRATHIAIGSWPIQFLNISSQGTIAINKKRGLIAKSRLTIGNQWLYRKALQSLYTNCEAIPSVCCVLLLLDVHLYQNSFRSCVFLEVIALLASILSHPTLHVVSSFKPANRATYKILRESSANIKQTLLPYREPLRELIAFITYLQRTTSDQGFSLLATNYVYLSREYWKKYRMEQTEIPSEKEENFIAKKNVQTLSYWETGTRQGSLDRQSI